MEQDPSFARLVREGDECLTPNANNKLEWMEMRWMARKREIPSIKSINDLLLIQRRLPAISPTFACLTLICGEACCILLRTLAELDFAVDPAAVKGAGY